MSAAYDDDPDDGQGGPEDGVWLIVHDDGAAHYAPVTDPAIVDLERRLVQS